LEEGESSSATSSDEEKKRYGVLLRLETETIGSGQNNTPDLVRGQGKRGRKRELKRPQPIPEKV